METFIAWASVRRVSRLRPRRPASAWEMALGDTPASLPNSV